MKLDLSSKKYKSEINQLYHPTGSFKTDSFDEVYSKDDLNKTKFIPILLKEWFYLVKKNGYLIIDYMPNKICDKEDLEKQMLWLWGKSYEIVSHDYIDDKRIRFVCKKIISSKMENDDITKWTFGIITNGKREDWILKIIESIRDQKIPDYEIIICGTYKIRKERDIKYLKFNKKDDKGWITKKKNLIVQNARYENICMLHDRMVLKENWYEGMKRWGNSFENLGCVQAFQNLRVNDWIASHFFIDNKEGEKFSFESYVDYRDWYESIWFLGQLNIFKKSIITKNNLWWDERLFYGQREDYLFSMNLNKHGFIHRFNPFSSVETLTNKYLNPTWIKFDPYSSIPKIKLDNINAFLKLASFIILKSFNFLGFNFSFQSLEKMRGKIYTLILLLNPTKYLHNKEWRNTTARK